MNRQDARTLVECLGLQLLNRKDRERHLGRGYIALERIPLSPDHSRMG